MKQFIYFSNIVLNLFENKMVASDTDR